MDAFDLKFEDTLARETEIKCNCRHTYLKCGMCGMCKDNLNNQYQGEIERLKKVLITHGIDPENVIIT